VTPVRVFADADELGAALAAEIAALARAKPGRLLLGCPGGRSLVSTYRALDLRGIVAVMMDEYVVNGSPAAAGDHFSCRAFAERELSAADEVWIPDPADPAAYDGRIAAAGGIDVFLLASGASDGHVAFLGPGSPREGGTAVVELAESTRRDNVATFPGFSSADEVPRHGVSVGLATVAAARRQRLVLHGADKRAAASRLLALDGFDPEWPASIVHACADAEILLDRAAAP
jgi:glucosamine-6-phosphate deaminase